MNTTAATITIIAGLLLTLIPAYLARQDERRDGGA